MLANDDLPESVAEVAEVIGREAALGLVGKLQPTGKRHRRLCLYVPKTVTPDHPLEQMLGRELAEKMVAEFGGINLQLSPCSYLAANLRAARVVEMHDEGATTVQIAEAVQLSAYRVREILNSHDDRKVELVCQMHADGASVREIARSFGLSDAAVRRSLVMGGRGARGPAERGRR